MRFGLPYKGSKNGIADWIIQELPGAEVFVDLFFGGGAVTHAGILSGKYKRFIVNDIDARLPRLFLECVQGKHTVEKHPEWITREEFNARKKDDAYIALVWSFGNNGKDYLYGVDIEDMKRAYHKAVYFDDIDALKPFGYILSRSDKKGVYERYLEYQRQIKKQEPNMQLEIVTRQVEIERLQSLQGLQSLQAFGTDYQQVPIPSGALIYCDIPYNSTNCGKYDGFDHQRFYEWADKQENIFISEYSMPDAFVPIAKKEKVVLSSADGNGQKAEEYIFTNQKTYDKLSDTFKQRIGLNLSEQMTFF
jgi:site-specific DNA-adenine methylase